MSISRLAIEGEMTIYRAAELKRLLLDAVAANTQVELDLSQVSELDTAGLQLLMLAKQLARQLRHELHLHAHSPVVLEVFELLNVAAFFGDPLVIAQPA